MTDDPFDTFLRGVKPLKKKVDTNDDPPPVTSEPFKHQSAPSTTSYEEEVPPFSSPATGRPTIFSTTDRKVGRKMQTGKLTIHNTLDLHGLTRAQALDHVTRFIHSSVQKGCRWVLVITGKGHDQPSVLRSSFPQWIQTPSLARHVITMMPAHQNDGGSGAFYLELRVQKASETPKE